MYSFHQRINRKEIIIGWYATTLPNNNSLILNTSSLIHDFYSLEYKNPIHIVIDTNLSPHSGIDTGTGINNRGINQLNIRGFISKSTNISNQLVVNMFQEIKVDILLSDIEIICLNQMIHGQINPSFQSETILSSITTLQEDVLISTNLLLTLLEKIFNYLNEIVEGKRIPNPEIGIMITDILGSLQVIFQSLFLLFHHLSLLILAIQHVILIFIDIRLLIPMILQIILKIKFKIC